MPAVARTALIAALCWGGTATAQVPRAPDGHPSLEGVWTNRSLTTLERRPIFKTLAIPAAQAKAFETAADGRPPIADDVGQKDTEWWEPGATLARIGGEARASWIVEPADGRLPYTEAGLKRLAAAQAAADLNFDGPEVRPGPERCLTALGGITGPPLLNGSYNAHHQIVQTRDYVVIHSEMIHDVRIVPLTPTPPLPKAMRPITGDPAGRWEGDTLVVETRGFHPVASYRVPTRLYLSPDARVTERFTRISPSEIRYDFAVDDPVMFKQVWRAEMVLIRTADPIYEYACHEGNYSLPGILAGGRQTAREAAATAP
ncbi:MAG: hypothetical protein KKE02_13270 [Alphaproteobacteria bacterium]|nr:hypothetical protein [Alphaproteobacteria bacterium]MBU1516230.1 hypothetical protein [Alphaproteobacteria bacterium]MBU2095767.1 hypothetical protein [Alphaproteobacteria bacterium]MBU2151984.1 hypothetical protein [Alphaproteobacteria bacterium]MBU2306834.1 hypothetical protein [Alphaproteobacteria bacterium]